LKDPCTVRYVNDRYHLRPPVLQEERAVTSIDEALAQGTLCAAFQVTATAHPDRVALRTFGTDETITYADAAARVARIASGLASLGVGPGDVVGLMLDSRSEFHLADLAALHLGALPFSIYNSNPAEKIVPLLENAEAKIVIAEPHYAPVLASIIAERPDLLETVIVVDDDAGAGSMTLAELEALTPPEGFAFAASWQAVAPDTLAMLIYTSGTTGEPKGAEWTHHALMENLRGFHRLIPVSEGGRMVSYLPMAHLAERFMSHYGMMVYGLTITSVPDAADLAAALREVRPTRFFGVPRIYEKLAEPARKLLDGPGGAQAAREALGFDQAEYLGSAAAPARADILAFFSSLGLTLIENWGMSETAMTLINPPDRVKAGTVGKPTPGVEARIADDGELMIRGPIFSGYRNEPRRTRDAFDDAGWLHTGDVATVDEDGYYRIVDRKKDIIINSAGKNMAPVMIENAIKTQSPLIGFVIAVGDGRKYVTALVTLDELALADFAQTHGLAGTYAELTQAPEVRAAVGQAIEAANATLARVEQIKRFIVLEEPWIPGTDEVTSTMKLRRRAITTKYADAIDELYAEAPVGA
jgi:long-subunit acyl-CoA synthetase (AMP-forming)